MHSLSRGSSSLPVWKLLGKFPYQIQYFILRQGHIKEYAVEKIKMIIIF